MAKKGFFERLGLVESTEPSSISNEELQQYLNQSAEPSVPYYQEYDVEVSAEALEGLVPVDTIYVQAGLEDLTKSIFKVDEFSKVLPADLPTDVKRQSVVGILTASGLQVEQLKDDATQRIGALSSVLGKFTEQSTEVISQSQAEISSLEAQIDELKTKINDRKNLQEQQEKLVEAEVEKIENVVKFLG